MTLVLGTAGHVDHGKTALVLALTGHDTDRLPEEKARGISIALGFAPLALPSGQTFSLIDVPGHEKFVRHMVAGSSGVDGYLLCVAADDGVMPQTIEHKAVLDLLGVADGVVAVTKCDLMDPELAVADVRELVGDGPEVVPVSARTGDGIAELRDALERLAARLERRTAGGRPRLFVDRAFSVAGAGTVVTGTLWGGQIAVGDRVSIIPGDVDGRVRGIQAHDRDVDRAESGRVALNLSGCEKDDVPRGSCVVAADDVWSRSPQVDVAIQLLPDAGGPLRTRRQLQAFLGTMEFGVTCVVLDADVLEPGDRGYAQLRFVQDVPIAEGDRIVLRSAERRTVGGAVVIDAHPARHGKGANAATRLAILERGAPVEIMAVRVADAGARGLLIAEDDADVVVTGATVIAGRWRVASDRVEAAQERVRAAVAAGAVPWATAIAASGLVGDAADSLLTSLVEEGTLVREGTHVRAPGERTRDPVADAVAGVIVAAGRQPPGLVDLAEETGLGVERLNAILVTLREEGRVVAAGELCFAAEVFASARDAAVAALSDQPLTIGALRDLWGVGRRHALALATGLDAAGVTRRVGDERVLRRSAR